MYREKRKTGKKRRVRRWVGMVRERGKKGEEEGGEGVRRSEKEIVPTSLCETKI